MLCGLITQLQTIKNKYFTYIHIIFQHLLTALRLLSSGNDSHSFLFSRTSIQICTSNVNNCPDAGEAEDSLEINADACSFVIPNSTAVAIRMIAWSSICNEKTS